MICSFDVSPDFRPSKADALVMARLIRHAETPRAVRIFSNTHHRLTDYGYWFALGTLWVSYTGWSDLRLWRRLFSSQRPSRETSLMKPSELAVWRTLPKSLTLFRAHRPDETDWISYALDPLKAAEFAHRRGVISITEYTVPKDAATCIFLRRGETEVIVLDPANATFVRVVPVVYAKAQGVTD